MQPLDESSATYFAHRGVRTAWHRAARATWPMRAWLVLLMCCAGPAIAAETAQSISLRALDHLQRGQYGAVEAMFTPAMAQAVPAARLQALWESLPAQFGAYRQRGMTSVSTQGSMRMSLTRLEFERGALNAQIAIDEQDRVAGLLLKPVDDVAPPPALPADAPFEEREVRIGADAFALPGTLAMPKGTGPFPAVVLVHGSGPNDRDETIGPNRPFLDIARGLAAQGIAVLRYEKRTRAHPQQFSGRSHFTVDDEATDDAVAAIAMLRAQPGIDARRIFVLGHSLGGMLAPRIAQRSGEVDGLILLAAPARPLLTLLAEQNRHLLGAQARDNAEARAFLQQLDARIANVRGSAPDDSRETPLDLPAGYWRSVEAIDPVADALKLGLPMLLLQGGRDFQVIDADWQLWKDALGTRDNVRMRHYSSLNHLGISGEGPGSLAEYQRAGHVDATLIDDIARWIEEH